MTATLPTQRTAATEPGVQRRIAVHRILTEHLAPIGPHGEYVRVIPALLAALDPHLAADRDPVTVKLRDRELEVLRLVAAGQSNHKIGQKLDISADTVKTHLQRIYRRLGAHDRAHAVAIAYKQGILR